MESYEDFIRTQLARLGGEACGEKRDSPCSGSSAIRFHGVPILRPLLTAERRREVLRYRTEALELEDRRNKSALGRRMLHLQELLESVQLRKAPTLREFMGDWERGHGELGGGASPEAPPHLLTSTARGSAASTELPEFQSLVAEADVSIWGSRGREGAPQTPHECLLTTETHADVSHQSASSGYATHDNTELSAGHTQVMEGHKEVTETHTELTEGHAEVAEGHAEVTALQTEDAAGDTVVIAGGGRGEEEQEGEREGVEEEAGPAEAVGGAESLFRCCAVGGAESLSLCCAVGGAETAPDVLSGAGPAGGCGDPAAPAGPERMSLQTLLKKSQEYRQRQRQLRHARAHSLSDKENRPGGAQPPSAGDRRPGAGGAHPCPSGRAAAARHDRAAAPREQEPAAVGLGSGEGRAWRGDSATETPPPAPKSPPPSLRRFDSVPTPQVCTSPIHCKRTGRPVRKLPVNTPFSASGGHRGRQSGGDQERQAPGGGAQGGGAQGAELAQLELNLSSLKALITDLQATLTDTPAEEPRPTGPAPHTAVQPRPLPSLAQRRRVPDLFRNILVLSDASNQAPAGEVTAARPLALETLSDVGGAMGPGSAPGGKPLTPEAGAHGHDPRAKRRLLMSTRTRGENRPPHSMPKGWISVLQNQQLQLQQTHAGQLQALVQEQQAQLQALLQSLSLQGVSVLGPSPSSGVKGVEPRPLSQPPCKSTLSSAWRPLVAAAIRGYLTRRLLRTERLTQLRRTVKDSLQVLQTLHTQTPGRQDLLLQERVLLQLRSARYEIHDVFCCSPAERVRIVSCDRELLRDRELKRQESGWTQSRGRCSLSAATMKALERKRRMGVQKRAAERQRGSVGGVCGMQVRRHTRGELRPALSDGNR